MGRCRAGLVFLPIFSCNYLRAAGRLQQAMALIQAGLIFVALSIFLILEACLGSWLLRKLNLNFRAYPEQFLLCVSTGVIATEIGLALAQWTQRLRLGSIIVLLLASLPALAEFPRLWESTVLAFRQRVRHSPWENYLLLCIAGVLLMEFLASLAPLTGSDALHYHFTTQQLFLKDGFLPVFFNSQSFLCGQNHLLILLGLALGSEKLAMAFVYLGGVLAALAVYCLAVRLVSRITAMAFALVFISIPLVLWQMSLSGSPDIWMAVFTAAATLVLSQMKEAPTWRHVMLAGFLTGGVAGAKYSGCLIAAALLLALIVEYRSLASGFLFFTAALFAGMWPYVRNLTWTRDPFFPFLTAHFFPNLVNPIALADLLTDTGVGRSKTMLLFPGFLLFSRTKTGSTQGFWEFYGPLVLALAPLAVLAFRNTREWRVRVSVWVLSSLAIYLTSGLPRFVLPVFPLALSCMATGVFYARQKDWKLPHRIAVASLAMNCMLGAVGLLLYTRPAISTALGFTSPENYLRENAPDYQIAETVNRVLAGGPAPGKALVFFRHLYYLRVPYVLGDPAMSWGTNPKNLLTRNDWFAFFRKEGIAYVVRSPDYPASVAPILKEMERRGELSITSEFLVDNFRGKRSAGERQQIPVVILRVNLPGGPSNSSP